MTLIIVVLLFVALAVASVRYGADSRRGRAWSVGALLDRGPTDSFRD